VTNLTTPCALGCILNFSYITGSFHFLPLHAVGRLAFLCKISQHSIAPNLVAAILDLIEPDTSDNSAIRSTDPENPTLEPNMKWIERPIADHLN